MNIFPSLASLIHGINSARFRHERVCALSLSLGVLLLPLWANSALGQQASPPHTVVSGHEHEPNSQVKVSRGDPNELRESFPDVSLSDQNGRRVRFYNDVIKDKVVVINFVYTTCTAICPSQGRLFSRLQKQLGVRAGRDVHLVSITTDPLNDTPARLKAWGGNFHAEKGWTLLTGEQAEMNKLLAALKGDISGPGMHTPVLLIYNDTDGTWARTSGLASLEEIIKLINGVVDARAASTRPGKAN